MIWQKLLLSLAGAAALVACCGYTWRIIHTRWRHGFVLPRRRRGPVPWRLSDFPFFFLLSSLAVGLIFSTLHKSDAAAPALHVAAEAKPAHPLIQLMHSNAGLWFKLLAVLAAALLAPVSEEFSFRLLGQNWLEHWLLRWKGDRVSPSSRVTMERCSVLGLSFFFASLHFRWTSSDSLDFRSALLAQSIVYPFSVALIVLLLARRTRQWRRYLYGTRGLFFRDVRLGLSAFFAVTPVVMLLQMGMLQLTLQLPTHMRFAPDPFPLFFFSLAAGYLAQRTRRITASVALHVFFNSFSLLLAFIAGLFAQL